MYNADGQFEVAQGMAGLHLDPAYRTMLLDEGIKPVFRISNIDGERTRQELERFRAMGYHAEPCHEAFGFDAGGLYDFEGAGSLFYLFVSASKTDLADILEVDKTQKTADDKATKLACALEIGRLLGYPKCCSEFYASFPINPHQTTFLLRPWQASTAAIAPLQHPTLRLLGHFSCTLHCEVTEAKHARILDGLKRRLPDVAAWVEPALSYPVLLFDHGATVFAGVGSAGAVAYERAWHIGAPKHPIEAEMRAHIERGDRIEVSGPWVRVFAGEQLLGAHDTRAFTILPLLMEVDDQPVGKRVRHVGVPNLSKPARYLVGDLLHAGHRASYLVPPQAASTGTAEQWLDAATAGGVDTLVLTAPAPMLAEVALGRGLQVVGAGCAAPIELPSDRHSFADGFERFSRGRDPTPAPADPLPGETTARPHLMWPTTLLEDLVFGKRHQVVRHRLEADPAAADVLEQLGKQVAMHVATSGTEIVVGVEHQPLLDALLGQLSGPLGVVLETPIEPARFRALAAAHKDLQLEQQTPDGWLNGALSVLGRLPDRPFGEVGVRSIDGAPAVVGRAGSSEVRIRVQMVSRGWNFDVDRDVDAAGRRWLAGLRGLLVRRERSA